MKLFAFAVAASLFVTAYDEAFAQSYDYSYDTAPEQVSATLSAAPLTDAHGMTLYTFDKDAQNVSNCDDSCTASWPPYLATADMAAPGDGFTRVARQDGTAQWALNGAPLYLWVGDIAPGDTTGDGVGGVWHIAR